MIKKSFFTFIFIISSIGSLFGGITQLKLELERTSGPRFDKVVEYLAAAEEKDADNLDKQFKEKILGLKKKGETPLHRVALLSKLDNVKFLVKTFKDKFATNANTDTHGNSVLHFFAGFNKNLDVMKFLVQEDQFKQEFTSLENTKNKNRPLHTALIRNANLDIIEFLMNEFTSEFATLKNNDGNRPLDIALIRIKDKKLFQKIILKFTKLHKTKDNTLFHHTMSLEPSLGLIKNFDKKSTLFTEKYNNDGNTPLHIAAQYIKDKEVMKYLIEDGPLKKEFTTLKNSKTSFTPLHEAAQWNKNGDVIKLLAQKFHSEFTTSKDNEKQLTPFDIARRRDEIKDYINTIGLEVLKNELDNDQPNFNTVVDLLKNTPFKSDDTLEPKYKIALLKLRDLYENTPLHIAMKKTLIKKEQTSFFVNNFKDEIISDQYKNKRGNTILHSAIRVILDIDSLTYLLDKEQYQAQFLDPNFKGLFGDTLLHRAVKIGLNDELFNFYFKTNIDLFKEGLKTFKNGRGKTPIAIRIKLSSFKNIKYFADNNLIDPEYRDKDNNSIFHEAASNLQLDIETIKFFATDPRYSKHFLNPHLKNNQGKSPLDRATQSTNKKIKTYAQRLKDFAPDQDSSKEDAKLINLKKALNAKEIDVKKVVNLLKNFSKNDVLDKDTRNKIIENRQVLFQLVAGASPKTKEFVDQNFNEQLNDPSYTDIAGKTLTQIAEKFKRTDDTQSVSQLKSNLGSLKIKLSKLHKELATSL